MRKKPFISNKKHIISNHQVGYLLEDTSNNESKSLFSSNDESKNNNMRINETDKTKEE
ncbi:14905_t:CDS:2, partial [Dentiscutata heterogama]